MTRTRTRSATCRPRSSSRAYLVRGRTDCPLPGAGCPQTPPEEVARPSGDGRRGSDRFSVVTSSTAPAPEREEPWIVGAENWTGEVFEYLYLVLII